MSSNYLNYELSKELHDLGVVFEGSDKWYVGQAFMDWNDLVSRDEELTMACQVGISAPSTAQLIDELIRRGRLELTGRIKERIGITARDRITDDLVITEDKCATSASGKALIALVKEKQQCKI